MGALIGTSNCLNSTGIYHGRKPKEAPD